MRRRGFPLLLVMVICFSTGGSALAFGGTVSSRDDFGVAETSRSFGVAALAGWLSQAWKGWEEAAGLWLADTIGITVTPPGSPDPAVDRSGSGVDPNGHPSPRG